MLIKLSWWLILKPSSFIDLVVSLSLSYIFNLRDTELSTLLRVIVWNLSGLAIRDYCWTSQLPILPIFLKHVKGH